MSETETVDAEINAEPTEQSPEVGAAEEIQPNREMRYRLERNTAREELAAVQSKLETLQRLDIERIAGERLSHPSDVFTLSGNSVADYVTDGLVDLGKITADVEAIILERPGLAKNRPATDPTQGLGSNPGKPAPSWSTFIKD